MTLRQGIERKLKEEVPEVKKVVRIYFFTILYEIHNLNKPLFVARKLHWNNGVNRKSYHTFITL
jgi:hypothetical protein